MRYIKTYRNSLIVAASLATACGGGSSSTPDAPVNPPIDGPAIDGPPVDAPWGPMPAPASLNFNDTVNVVLHAGSAWYVGGFFTLADMIPARKLIGVDLGGQPTGCSVGAGFDNSITAMAQIGNALYVGGPFLQYRGASANHIAKLDATTCELDATFSPPANNGFDADLRAIVAVGNTLYVGGLFTTYRGASANYIAKIDATTGALDTTFSPPANNGANGPVITIAATATDVYLGGSFSTYRGGSANYLAHVNATTGVLDTTFSPPGATANGFNSEVYALVLAGSSLYVGGGFTQYKNVASSAMHLAKLNAVTGAIDTTFSPVGNQNNGFENTVVTMAASATSLYVGGPFRNYRGVTDSALRVAKLNLTTGAIDTTFSPVGVGANGFTGNINKIALAGNDLFVSGAPLGAYRNATSELFGVTKLDATNGAIDNNFFVIPGHDRPGLERNYFAQALLVTGQKLWIGGYFDRVGGKNANGIARIDDTTGKLDRTFSPPGNNGFDRGVQTLTASADALYVGGEFTAYRGVANSAIRIAKLDLATGAIDTTFSPVGATANGFNGRVQALTISNGSLYVGGGFISYRGGTDNARCLAKLNPTTGALDTTFSPPGAGANGFDDDVRALAVRNGALYVGGDFVSYRGGANNANGIVKLDPASGVLDTTFSPPAMNGVDSTVTSLTTTNDAIFIGGDFTNYRGQTVNHIAKLNAAGALDATFTQPGANAGFDSSVDALAVAAGALYVGGAFTAYRGVAASASYMAKLDLATGSVDTTFTPSGAVNSGPSVISIAPYQSSLMLGGQFTNCEFGTCFANAHRVNLQTRQPE